MFGLGTTHHFELYSKPTDMRKSFDSLRGLVINNLDQDPDNGTVYIFINKVRNKVKLLHWQSGGFILYYKRLETGTFDLPKYDSEIGSLSLSYAQLILLIDGISITNLTHKKRFKKA
ncbi:IS66 family insertion sequence element accessory protein TnpB [Aquimarina agarilytica]|uniref:IS66 family insertion sequence element accessory protein TnpB n=1 Tax=Aquimarina agarilytica TaxID=1087449 RepID=UPI000287E4F0|nr:IS66 family insertion sequence element accessory protein TnpB [Aquimarina agarilytica]